MNALQKTVSLLDLLEQSLEQIQQECQWQQVGEGIFDERLMASWCSRSTVKKNDYLERVVCVVMSTVNFTEFSLETRICFSLDFGNSNYKQILSRASKFYTKVCRRYVIRILQLSEQCGRKRVTIKTKFMEDGCSLSPNNAIKLGRITR